ncbi:hypothetical protein ACXYMU_12380 [Pontibacter sp. CAU 1760]
MPATQFLQPRPGNRIGCVQAAPKQGPYTNIPIETAASEAAASANILVVEAVQAF